MQLQPAGVAVTAAVPGVLMEAVRILKRKVKIVKTRKAQQGEHGLCLHRRRWGDERGQL